MSRTPYGLTAAVICKKKSKTKNVMHAIWSGHGQHWQKIGENEKCHAHHWSDLYCQWAKILRKNKKCHARHMVWSWPSSAKKRNYKKSHACHLVWPWSPLGKKKKMKNIMHKIWSGILFPGRHLMGILKCHQMTPLNKMVELNSQAVRKKFGWIHGWNSNYNLTYR